MVFQKLRSWSRRAFKSRHWHTPALRWKKCPVDNSGASLVVKKKCIVQLLYENCVFRRILSERICFQIHVLTVCQQATENHAPHVPTIHRERKSPTVQTEWENLKSVRVVNIKFLQWCAKSIIDKFWTNLTQYMKCSAPPPQFKNEPLRWSDNFKGQEIHKQRSWVRSKMRCVGSLIVQLARHNQHRGYKNQPRLFISRKLLIFEETKDVGCNFNSLWQCLKHSIPQTAKT